MVKRRHVLWLCIVFFPPSIWVGYYGGILQMPSSFIVKDTDNIDYRYSKTLRDEKAVSHIRKTSSPAPIAPNKLHFRGQGRVSSPKSPSIPQAPAFPKKRRRPVLTLHVGPPKTGTTTIQWYAGTYEAQLRKNNIYYVGFYLTKQKTEFNTHELCYACRQKKKKECAAKWKELEEILDKHYQANHDVFLSEEIFSDYKQRTEQEFLIPYLRPMLAKWKVRVVLSYRRYYEWVPSWYTQKYQPTGGHKTLLDWPSLNSNGRNNGGVIIPTIRSYFRDDGERRYNQLWSNPEKWSSMLTSNLHNETTDIFVFNMHQKHYAHEPGALEKDWFCQMLPDATEFCEFIRARNTTISKNPSSSKHIHYDLLAVEANNRGWINSNTKSKTQRGKTVVTRHETRTALEEFATKKLGLDKVTDYDHLDCLSQNDTRRLLNFSLELEAKLVPNFYSSPQGKAQLTKDFESAVKSHKFCSVHVNKTLQDKRWKTFFQSLGKGQT